MVGIARIKWIFSKFQNSLKVYWKGGIKCIVTQHLNILGDYLALGHLYSRHEYTKKGAFDSTLPITFKLFWNVEKNQIETGRYSRRKVADTTNVKSEKQLNILN